MPRQIALLAAVANTVWWNAVDSTFPWKSKNELPRNPREITVEWMQRIMEARGCLPVGVKVLKSETKLVDEDCVFSSSVAEVHITYADGEGKTVENPADHDLPARLFCKFDAPCNFRYKMWMQMNGFLRAEALFYTDIAPQLRGVVRLPEAYFVKYVHDGAHFCLMMEDMRPSVAGSQIDGCDVRQAEMAMTGIAKVHAYFWTPTDGSPRPDRSAGVLPEWLQTWAAGDRYDMAADVFADRCKLREARYRDIITPDVQNILDWFKVNMGAFLRDYTQWATALTLCHGDFRLRNMFFPSEAGGTFAIFDWQAIHRGCNMYDVAYCLGLNLPVELRRQHLDRLISLYHSTLIESGVSGLDYPLEKCRQEFNLNIIIANIMFMYGEGAMTEKNQAAGDATMDAAMQRGLACLADMNSWAVLTEFVEACAAQRAARPAAPGRPWYERVCDCTGDGT